MAEVLVLVDHVDGKVRKTTSELLTIARRLGEPSAVYIGAGFDAAKETLASFGADKVYVVESPEALEHLVVPQAEVLAQLVEKASPAAVLVPRNAEGKEIAARLAVKTESGLITDAVDVQAGDGRRRRDDAVGLRRLLHRDRRPSPRAPPIIAVKPNSAAARGGRRQPAPTRSSTSRSSDAAKGARITESKPKQATGRPELTEAAIVVSGGRGTAGDFATVEAFADSLGAAVGASRAAVDAGWYPHSIAGRPDRQAGLPQLYVACGISGAIQHRAGMQTSKTIIAVNKDEEAPIFELVDFGVVGDLFTVLPQATEAIQAGKD